MKTKIIGMLAVCCLALAFTGCATSGRSTAWEYKVAIVPGNSYAANDVPAAEKTLNSLTEQGWRLVSVSAGGPNPQIVMVFKRHKK